MALTLEKATRIIAHSLSISPAQLHAAFAPAGQADLPAIIQFRQVQLGKRIAWNDEDYLGWRYDFAGDLSVGSNRLWLLKFQGELVGMIGVDSVHLSCRGERIAAGNPLDLLVLGRMDGLGLGVWMSLFLQQRYSLMFAMGATKSSKTIVEKLFIPMADLGCWKCLLKSRRYLNKKIHSLFLPLTAKCVDAGLALSRSWRVRGKQKSWHIAALNDFTQFKDPLNNLMATYRQTAWILRERSAEFLQWRFLNNPRRQYQAIGLFRGDQLAGFAVYHIKDKCNLHIDDVFTAADNVQGAQALVVAMLEIASRCAVELVSFTAHEGLWQSIMAPLGFKFRNDGHLFGVAVAKGDTQVHFINSAHWWVTSCDTHSEGF